MARNATMPWAERQTDELVAVGPYVRVRGVGALTVLLVLDLPVRRFAREDDAGLRAELAALESMDLLTQADVARSGLVAEATFHRDCVAFRTGGEVAMRARTVRGSRGPRKVDPDVRTEIARLRSKGDTIAAIGQQLGLSVGSVHRALASESTAEATGATLPGIETGAEQTATAAATDDAGDAEQERIEEAEQAAITGEAIEEEQARAGASDASETLEAAHLESDDEATTTDRGAAPDASPDATQANDDAIDPDMLARRIASQRAVEWILSRLGKIEEQSALFPPVAAARFGGVLLALALLPLTGLLAQVRLSLGALANGLYGVRSVVTTLVAMALLRCKRPEQLKGFDPPALGAVVGLARAPEMKTLRRKIKALARDEGKVVELVRAMAKRHVDRVRDAVAFLYIDGHVRPYFGATTLGKAHHAASRIVLPATTDYWINDARGAPVLVVTTEGNAALTQVMPNLLAEARRAVGPDARPTVVFDRGGYSPKLFRRIVASGFEVLTYRKGKHPDFPRREFEEITVRRGGRDHPTLVRDRRIRLKGFGLIRCVAVLRDDGRQTHVLTTRTDLGAREILERMFARWQQENFFKYLEESFAFDALWTWRTIEGDPERTVPSPYRRFFEKKRKALKGERTRLLAKVERSSDENARIEAIDEQLVATERCLGALPERETIAAVRAPEPVLELARAPKLFADVIKMTAFHIETMLVAAVGPHLRRAPEEGRAFVADVMQLDARLEPRRDRLDVVIAPMSAPRYTAALVALCEHVNASSPRFPETDLALRFRVADEA